MTAREDNSLITISIAGVSWGTWDQAEGRATTSTQNKYYPGGMSPAVELGGRSGTEPGTYRKLLTPAEWDVMLDHKENDVGKAEVVVSEQMLDDDRNPTGRPMVIRGKLGTVNPGNANSNAQGERLVEIVVNPHN